MSDCPDSFTAVLSLRAHFTPMIRFTESKKKFRCVDFLFRTSKIQLASSYTSRSAPLVAWQFTSAAIAEAPRSYTRFLDVEHSSPDAVDIWIYVL